jgi:hypothetical protein
MNMIRPSLSKSLLAACLATATLLQPVAASAQALDACVFERRERLRVLQENGIGLTLGDESARLAALVAQARAQAPQGLSLAVGALTGRTVFFAAPCEGRRCTADEAARAVDECETRGGGSCVIIGLATESCFQQSYFPTSQANNLTRPSQAE